MHRLILNSDPYICLSNSLPKKANNKFHQEVISMLSDVTNSLKNNDCSNTENDDCSNTTENENCSDSK